MFRANCVTLPFWILSFWKSIRNETEITTHSSHFNPHNAGMGKILNASICIQVVGVFLKQDCSGIWKSSYVLCLRLFFHCCLGKLQFINSKPTPTKLTESSYCNFLPLSASVNICACSLNARGFSDLSYVMLYVQFQGHMFILCCTFLRPTQIFSTVTFLSSHVWFFLSCIPQCCQDLIPM